MSGQSKVITSPDERRLLEALSGSRDRRVRRIGRGLVLLTLDGWTAGRGGFFASAQGSET